MVKKTSFILFNDLINPVKNMTDTQAGQLFKIILEYCNGVSLSETTPEVQVAFNFVKEKIDFNNEKYKKTCEKNKENIAKRWNKASTDTTVYARIPPYTKHTIVPRQIIKELWLKKI